MAMAAYPTASSSISHKRRLDDDELLMPPPHSQVHAIYRPPLAMPPPPARIRQPQHPHAPARAMAMPFLPHAVGEPMIGGARSAFSIAGSHPPHSSAASSADHEAHSYQRLQHTLHDSAKRARFGDAQDAVAWRSATQEMTGPQTPRSAMLAGGEGAPLFASPLAAAAADSAMGAQYLPPKQLSAMSSARVSIPYRTAWFRSDTIDSIEKRSLPEFFTKKNYWKTDKQYKDARDFVCTRDIVHAARSHMPPESWRTHTAAAAAACALCSAQLIAQWRRHPERVLSGTAARRALPMDAAAALRMHSFLEFWDLINYRTPRNAAR
jgi:hypothetical protein